MTTETLGANPIAQTRIAHHRAPAVTDGYLTAVTALSPVSAWAVGGIASPSGPPAGQVILHWNGTAWSRVPPASRENLAGVAVLSASDAWAAGGAILHWNGQTWTTAATSSDAASRRTDPPHHGA